MAFGDLFKNRVLISLAIFVALAGVLFCGMPNIDSMHAMPRNCTMSNFYNALPPQNPSKIFLWFSLLISSFLIFAYTKLTAKSIANNSLAPRVRALKAQIAFSAFFNFLSEGLRKGIIHSKIYDLSPAF